MRYYYKIEVENTATQQKQMSKIYGSLRYHIPDKISSTIAYQYEKYLEVVGNEPVLLLLRKRFGQKCQLCWDDVRMQSTTIAAQNVIKPDILAGIMILFQFKFLT